MKKEVILAIFIGIIAGLFITIGVYRNQNEIQIVSDKPSIAISPTVNEDSRLTILSPEQEQILEKDQLLISGKTDPQLNLVILVNDSIYSLQSDDQGHFAIEVKLQELANFIIVTAFLSDGSTTTQERNIIYYPTTMQEETFTIASESAKNKSEASEASRLTVTPQKTPTTNISKKQPN